MSELGDAIKAAREAKGLTQEQFGAAFGITKSAISAWESGKAVPDHRKLAKLVEILALDPRVVAGIPSSGPIPTGPAGTAPANHMDTPMTFPETDTRATPPNAIEPPMPRATYSPVPNQPGPPDIPVWASAEAGNHGAMVLVNDPIDWIRRSERMLGVQKPFAFLAIGTSMSPAIEHGDQLVINPALLPIIGKDHVFLQTQEDGTILALVKRLLRVGATAWKVRQFNPPEDFDLPKAKWSKALVVSEKRVA